MSKMDAKLQAALLASEEEAISRQVATKATLMSMPMITFPEEYGSIVGQGKSAAYAMMAKDPDFPDTILIGRQRFMRTEALLAWMLSKERAAPLPEDQKKENDPTV